MFPEQDTAGGRPRVKEIFGSYIVSTKWLRKAKLN